MSKRPVFSPFLALALLGALLGAGCAVEEEVCPRLEACDIRKQGCQRRALRAAECLRGDAPGSISVLVRVVAAQDFIDEAVAAQKPETPEPEDLAFREALSLLDLSQAAADDQGDLRETLENVAAFYGDGVITVLDRGTPLSDAGAMSVLVHEFVHALQDATGDLNTQRSAETFDQWLAARAMIEGEATLQGLRARLEMLDEDEPDFAELFADYEQRRLEAADDAEDLWLLTPLLFPYAWGGDYLAAAFEEGGAARVQAVLGRVPRTTRQIIAGYGKQLPDDARWRVPLGGRAVAEVADAELSSVSHLGAWTRWQFARRHGLVEQRYLDALDDSLSVLSGAEGTIAVWRFRFKSPEVARRAAKDLAEAGFQTEREGSDAWLIAHGATMSPPAVVAWSSQEAADYGFASPVAALRCGLIHEPHGLDR